MLMTICIAEDRTTEEIAVKLLLLSLTRHCPDTWIVLAYPPASPAFAAWVTESIPRCELRTIRASENSSWNVKADALLKLLEEGHSEVWWLDSDIIVEDNFVERYKHVSADAVIACEEALYGAYRDGGIRASKWGLPLARTFPFSLNTGALRVSADHVDLLKAWKKMLEDTRYLAAQKQPWNQRPVHLMGDQDVLTALMSTLPFSTTPVFVLRRGRDIIQYFGFSAYTTRERLGNLFGERASLIHCQGWKPWNILTRNQSLSDVRSRLQRLYIELSPYLTSAESYRSQLDEPLPWSRNISGTASLLRFAGLRNSALTGLPIAMAVDLWRVLRHRMRVFRPT
jgi:hypothetical protein